MAEDILLSRLAAQNLRLQKENDRLRRSLAKAKVATAARRPPPRPKPAATMTFRAAAEAYIRAHEPGWKSLKHAQQWPQSLGAFVYPVFGERPVDRVDTALVMKALEPIWRSKTETASRVRGRIERVLDWATAHGCRSPEVQNPARWRGHLENLLPPPAKVARPAAWPALPYAELPALMSRLAADPGVGARALEPPTGAAISSTSGAS